MDPEQLGRRLRARRREKQMTIGQVAEGAGLSLPYVANLERGRGNPTLDALRAIAGVLGVPIGSLVDDPDDVSTPERTVIAFSQSPRFQETVARLAKQRKEPEDEIRDRIVRAMVASPRRSNGELNETDLGRLLDTYSLILGS